MGPRQLRPGGRPGLISLLLAFALIAALALGQAAGASPVEEDGGANGVGATPVIATLIPQKAIVPVLGSDGRYHAMYELLLTNTTAKAAKLRSVTVLDAESRRRLLTLTAKDMVAGGTLHMLDRNPVENTTLPPSESRVLFLSLAFKSKRAIPRRIEQRFDLTGFNPFTEKTTRLRYVAGTESLSRRQPPVLAPPLEGGNWLASDGCCTAAGHVSALFGLGGKLQAAERYAIDWIRIDPEGRIFHGDPSVLTNWVGYGAKIKAASAGVVIEAKDGLPDQTPLVKPAGLSFDDLTGNLVVVRMKSGLSAVYAHLIPGSLKVQVGDRVQVGEELGLLGNSGGSLAPHLHFHVVNGSSAASSDGYPYMLSSFQLGGSTDVDALMESLKGKAGFPAAAQLHPVTHRGELPLGFTIDRFPGGP